MRKPEERLRQIITQLRTEDHVDRYRVAEDLEVVLAGFENSPPESDFMQVISPTGMAGTTDITVGGVRVRGIKSLAWGIDMENDGPKGLLTLRAMANVDIKQAML